ncbi:bifunctional 2-polyprenyl-6-hydroxyphenol methylase/3-demethylubiquinol 3-O-methyltransferase UbiG [Desulfovibrio sp. JC010]|uniref:class I SAM-dependent methyltransferase n=1 Tax=Desulfovibrio sp. JC010 TaxID=2593641 RepID=UPI0013D39054|nr:class I SAM-dependent methyltransferase [Desulfovibrio sp. JC010]NDV27506.1 class I SAM-dependent methyltransferase [Desulfovibrio sp. JC010]
MIALYHHPQADRAHLRGRLSQLCGKEVPADSIVWFSHAGRSMTPIAGGDANLCAPLSSKCKVACFFESAVPLPNDAGVAAYFGQKLLDMGDGSEIFVSLGCWPSSMERRLVLWRLCRWLPSCRVERAPGARSFWRLTRKGEGLEEDLRKLPGRVYGLANDFAGFRNSMLESGNLFSDPDEDYAHSAELVFCNNLKRVLLNAFLMDVVFRAAFGSRRIRLLDVGGGFGFLGAALAERGHDVTVTDIMENRVVTGNRWLAPACGLEDHLRFEQGRMEDLSELGGTYDCITFWGSLLLCDREQVEQVLHTAASMLSPDGIIVVEERPSGMSGSDRAEQFSADEFNALLEKTVGSPTYFNPVSGKRISFDTAKHFILLAVAARDGRKLTHPVMSLIKELLRTVCVTP